MPDIGQRSSRESLEVKRHCWLGWREEKEEGGEIHLGRERDAAHLAGFEDGG